MKETKSTFNIINYITEHLPILNDCRPAKQVWHRFGITVVYYLFSMLVMSITVVVAGQRFPKDGTPLPDLGFEFLPVGSHIEHTPNNILHICAISTLIRFIFHRKGLTIMRRFLIIHGSTMLLRCATLVATSYPDPNMACRGYKPADTPSLFLKSVVNNTSLITCGDLLPSGHTLAFMVFALTWHKNTRYVEKCFFWVLALAGCLSLIITRLHYTNDILVGMYQALTVFCILLHTLIITHYDSNNELYLLSIVFCVLLHVMSLWLLTITTDIYHIFATDPVYRRKSYILNWLEADLVEDDDGKRLVDRNVNIVFTV